MTSSLHDATLAAVRAFNTEGPVVAADHYHIPPLERIDLDQVLGLVRDKKYFVLHAPRQTGKTSAMLALRDLLNGGHAGDYRCVYANVEAGQAARENVAEGMRAVLSQFALRASLTLGDDSLERIGRDALDSGGPLGALSLALSRWAAADRTPLVLLIDEIDALVGDTLLAVLRQLRAGYDQRPSAFPQSVVLCGVRDVRDYRIHSTAENRMVLGGSAFNVKAKSLRLGDFSEPEVRELLGQHTAATGQAFTEEALRLILTRTAGHSPWLVNALCREACFDDKAGRDRSRPITEQAIREAQERLIPGAGDPPRQPGRHVARGARAAGGGADADRHRPARVDRRGCRLRLRPGAGGSGDGRHAAHRQPDLRRSGAAPSELRRADGDAATDGVVRGRGRGPLDVEGLIAAFQAFFREHSEHWVQRFERYHEAGPQLLLQAHLQRIVNGGGRIEREYALGRGRTDLLVVWPQGGRERRFVVECKVRRGELERTVAEGVKQTRAYGDRCAAEAGHLIVFDRAPDRTWEEKIFRRPPSTDGVPVTVWGM